MHVVGLSLTLAVLGGCAESVPEPVRAPVDCEKYEIPHDGIDQDCNPYNEFDFDGDGFVAQYVFAPDGGWVPGLGPATGYARAHGLPLDIVGGDCDDFDPDVYPGAPGEEFYDAVDTNCDGSNDFDRDGDGWVPAGNWNEMTYYIANALHGFAEFEVLEGDCNDDDPFVNPDQEDIAYDGVDTNCDNRNDFDQDADQYIAEGFEDAWRAHVAANGETHPVKGFGDCDDANNFVNPGAPERSFTPRDVDCDGDPGRPRLGVFDYALHGTTRASLEMGNNYQLLAIGADAVDGFDGAGLFVLPMPLMPDADEPSTLVQLTHSKPNLVEARATWLGMLLTTVEDTRWGSIQLGTGFLGAPSISPPVWTDETFTGTHLVADPSGDFVCGAGPTTWLDDGSTAPSADICGLAEGAPVVCDPDCVALTDRGIETLPWTSPTRIEGDFALVDGRLYDAGGVEPFAITGADDAMAEHDYAAFIVDGQVYVEGPFGTVGPLLATPHDWPVHSERQTHTDFYADEVHLAWYWGYVTVFALDHDGNTTRIAMARIDP